MSLPSSHIFKPSVIVVMGIFFHATILIIVFECLCSVKVTY
jgi:hypothetical protein